MKRYSELFEEITSFENMLLAAKKAFRGKRGKRSVYPFYFHLETELIDLQEKLIAGTYRPDPFREFEIREPKIRKICSSSFRDRVVHHSICNVLEPIFERKLIYDTYACRKEKGTHVALKRAKTFSGRYSYFLKCDIKKFFESVDHSILKTMLRRIFKDPKLLRLLDLIIDHQVPESLPGTGLPIGNLTSQHFANLYLSPLDHFLKDHRRVEAYVRYMDDFLCFSDSKEFLSGLLDEIRVFVKDELALELKEKVVRIAPVTEGVPFLGFRLFKNLVRVQRANLVRYRQNIRQKEQLYILGRISEDELIRSLNSVIGHMSYGDTTFLRRRDLERSLKLA
jgi:retron-type reverse transcriptase